MAVTQADIDKLKALIFSGMKQSMEGGRMVTLDDLPGMRERLALMEAEFARRPTSFNRKVRFINE